MEGRGQMSVMAPKPPPDVEARIEFFSAADGGRNKPAFTGYRPAHAVREDYLTTGTHQYLDKEKVLPGETVLANITFATPQYYPHCLWIGKVISVQEGARLIGRATITLIDNKILESLDGKEP